MIYNDVYDYFFWKGVSESQKWLVSVVNYDIDLGLAYSNTTSRRCFEAFELGFCFGMALTKKEYKELVKVEVTRPKVVQKTEITMDDSLDHVKIWN